MQTYKQLNIDGKHIDEHRKIMQDYLGRKLARNEHVHHINGNKRDNRIENLMVVTAQEHIILHKQIYPVTKNCRICGKEFAPHKTKRKRAVVCSGECKIVLDKENAEKRKRPICQYTLSGELVKKWKSARDIQNALNIHESNINKCCNGVIRTYKGYVWKYSNI